MAELNSKGKPHYDLAWVKNLIAKGSWGTTWTADQTAVAAGLNKGNIPDAILCLTYADFSVSREDYKCKGYWQDAYKPTYQGIDLYIKLKVVQTDDDNVLILSFKKA